MKKILILAYIAQNILPTMIKKAQEPRKLKTFCKKELIQQPINPPLYLFQIRNTQIIAAKKTNVEVPISCQYKHQENVKTTDNPAFAHLRPPLKTQHNTEEFEYQHEQVISGLNSNKKTKIALRKQLYLWINTRINPLIDQIIDFIHIGYCFTTHSQKKNTSLALMKKIKVKTENALLLKMKL